MAQSVDLIDKNFVIKPRPGEIFQNRSFKYLSPSMKIYGEEFTTKMRLLAGLAIAIQDFGFHEKEDRVIKNELYYLIDVNGKYVYNKYVNADKSRIDFMNVVSWLREQDFFVKDYAFDSGRSGNQHVICLKLPFNNIHLFLEGKYSQMYPPDFLDKYINKTIITNNIESINPVFGVLSKYPKYLPTYLEQLNFYYGTSLTVEDIKHHNEYDIPPLPKNEILRW